jgi:hypothetical protein
LSATFDGTIEAMTPMLYNFIDDCYHEDLDALVDGSMDGEEIISTREESSPSLKLRSIPEWTQ